MPAASRNAEAIAVLEDFRSSLARNMEATRNHFKRLSVSGMKMFRHGCAGRHRVTKPRYLAVGRGAGILEDERLASRRECFRHRQQWQ